MKIFPSLLYWTLFVGTFTAVFASYDGRWLGTLWLNLIRLPFMWGIAYFAFQRNFGRPVLPMPIKIILILILILTSALLSRYIFGLIVYPLYFEDGYSFDFWRFNALFNQFFVMTAGVAGYGTLTYLIEQTRWNKKREELITEKKNAELDFYRAQVHPHFLFNTLNGIYSESLKADGKAPDLILKLSELLRFMLYECNREAIALRTELKVIDDYIALEELRYGQRLTVDFELDPNLNSEILIPPLIFLALVENAFKHGVSSQPDESFISIHIRNSHDTLVLSVRNTDFTEDRDETGHKRGIGLVNVHRQLELIFEDRFSLRRDRKNGIFETELRIPFK